MKTFPPFVYAGIIILGGIIGWAVAYFGGGDTQAQSTYTGYGVGIGAAAAALFFVVTYKRG